MPYDPIRATMFWWFNRGDQFLRYESREVSTNAYELYFFGASRSGPLTNDEWRSVTIDVRVFGNGPRRMVLRGWRSQDRGGSNPPFCTNNLRLLLKDIVTGQVVKYLVKSSDRRLAPSVATSLASACSD